MSLTEQISNQLKESMKAKDEVRTRTLRSIRSEILKKEKEGKGAPTDEDVVAAISRLLKQRQDSIEQFEKAGRDDLVQGEKAEAEILKEFLPESLSEEEIDSIIDEVIASTGAASAKEMGKVMGPVMGKLKATGKLYDGGMVNQKVKAKLS
ncbi:MAG: GatB/YqeY domain-containing protein [Candidatus Omnitrophica bacterium]|nr:GatB/YqeY domain-containing protein [Candidatus Omnitrophota bacterium]